MFCPCRTIYSKQENDDLPALSRNQARRPSLKGQGDGPRRDSKGLRASFADDTKKDEEVSEEEGDGYAHAERRESLREANLEGPNKTAVRTAFDSENYTTTSPRKGRPAYRPRDTFDGPYPPAVNNLNSVAKLYHQTPEASPRPQPDGLPNLEAPRLNQAHDDHDAISVPPSIDDHYHRFDYQVQSSRENSPVRQRPTDVEQPWAFPGAPRSRAHAGFQPEVVDAEKYDVRFLRIGVRISI